MSEDTVALVIRFQNGDADAAEQLFVRYFDRLDQFAGRRMSDPLKRRVGSDDIALSVYRSFFEKAQEGVLEVSESGQLWSLLAKLAHRKILQNVEWHSKTQKRSFNRELSHGDDDSLGQIAGQSSDPEQQAVVDDAIEAALSAVSPKWKDILNAAENETDVPRIAAEVGESETEVRRVLILRMKCSAGLDNEALAELLDCSEVTVRRIWRNLISLVQELSADSE